MPPKRSRSGTNAVASASTSKKQKTAAPKSKAKPKPKMKPKSKSTRTREIREDSPPEKDFDSYDDAVRDAILNTTKSRYDVSLQQDHLAFAAALMESSSPSSMSLFSQDVMKLSSDGGGGGVGGQDGEAEGRGPQQAKVYSLGTFCMHAIVKNFECLAVDAVTPASTKSSAAAAGRVRSGGVGGGQGNGGGGGQRFRRQVQHLPFYLSERLFKVLKHARPELLSTKLWTGLFFNPNTIAGDRVEELDLEGLIPSQVTDTVVRAHLLWTLGVGPRLTKVNLNHQTGLSDKVVSGLVGACPNLARLSLKGCSKVGDLTLASLPEGSIEELNISFVGATACTVKGISGMVLRCRALRVLKVAGLANVKDAVFVQLEKNLALEKEQQQEDTGRGSGGGGGSGKKEAESRPLSRLENLKISTTSLGDRGLKVVLALCGRTLRRLDISQTGVMRPSLIGQYCVWDDAEGGKGGSKKKMTTRLEKLNLTRLTMSTPTELSTLLQQLPANSLHTLLMGYITHSRSVFSDGVFEEMSSSDLEELEDEGEASSLLNQQGGEVIPVSLRTRPKFFLRTLSLFGNYELGRSARDRDALRWHLNTLAPYLKRLELGYTGYDHEVLLGLIDPPHRHRLTAEEVTLQQGQEFDKYNDVLEELGMDATRISDEGAVVLSRLRGLSRLSMANTQISKDAVEIIAAGCPRLSSLDLTSCRGVPVVQRRTLLKDIRQRASSSSSQLPTVPAAPDDTAVLPELSTQGNPAAAASTEGKPGGEATTKTLQGKEDPTLAETNYPILWWTPPLPPTLQEKQEQGIKIELPYTVDTCGLEYKCTFTTDRSVLSTTNVVLFRGSQLDEQDLPPAATRPASQAWVLNNVLKDAEEAKKREVITSILDPTHVWSHSFPPTTATTDFVETVFQSRSPNNPIQQQQSFVDIVTMPPKVDLQEKNRLRTLGKENGGRAAAVWITTGDSEGGGCVDAPKPFTAQEIMQDYKFVFALERVNCQDYITQHLADATTVGVVPIVDGPQDYSRFSPSENAFVEIRNFLAPEQFAQEIDRLDRNDALYLERLFYRVNKDTGSGEGVEAMAEGTGALLPLFRQTFGGGAISESGMAEVSSPTIKTWTPDRHGVYCGICELAHKLSQNTYDWTTHTQQRKEIASNNTPSAPICETSPRYLPGLPAQMQAYDAYLQAQNELAFIRQQEEMEALLRQEQLEDSGSVMSTATVHVVNVTVSFNSNNNTGYNVSDSNSLENNTIGQPSIIVLHQDVSSSKAQNLAEVDPATAYHHHIPATSISSTDGTTLPLSEVHYLLLLILAMFVGVGALVLILSKSARQKLFWPWRHLLYKKLPRDEGGADALTLERVMLRELGEDLLYD
ncbi:hypothetical protein KI688_008381 [Linnemannia hyalina]|uniref:Fucosyltransferase n=1 Tax=Linnemannia hyalina TaxID=64524 RepID=A0A9P8BWF7_9FUNG|nr:hypothetical protein KI688_008381 [Linnemannia hyalina]